LSGQGTKKTTERDLTIQVLEHRNGQWLYRHQIRDQIQLLDQRFSEQAIHAALADLTSGSDRRFQEKLGSRGGIMYRFHDESRPISTKTDFDDLPARPSSAGVGDWPE
jgi:hypothetical protein